MYDNNIMYRKVKCAYDMITVIWFISIIHQTVYLIVFLGGCLISDKFSILLLSISQITRFNKKNGYV